MRALFNVPRTSLELLPYYSRLVATLSTCMKDISSMLLQLLEDEFNALTNKKVRIAYLALELHDLYLLVLVTSFLVARGITF